jgi:hypothetical protein
MMQTAPNGQSDFFALISLSFAYATHVIALSSILKTSSYNGNANCGYVPSHNSPNTEYA